ncbi:CHAD domain-containing protein [Acinetobacter silvestris]|uniref:CHAD domain-containing protein n=1 Tax=Acinetobacter silvestris TaxID=1977882 RepID=A0A1Y3CLR0_9GAMM|nr:CHAD domain-containing protein [Acinetobacter silvestris]OTG66572.1 hypothetical protein B9T28_04810 [Acinetobacter silvestris]
MSKIELKFQIPKDQTELLIKALQRKNAQKMQLHTNYYDSDDFKLSQHAVSLRQRLQDQNCVQSLNIQTQNQSKHSEFNINFEQQTNPALNLQAYKYNKHIDKNIIKLLNSLQNNLRLQFEIQVERWVTISSFQNSKIQVQLDQGQISHNHQVKDLIEIKFQLQQGTIQDFISFIFPYIKRYHLCLNGYTKLQQCYLLAQGLTEYPTQNQSTLQLKHHDSKAVALKKMIQNCLEHLLPNSTAIASGYFNSQHVHQARVAIRRLRSAFSMFSNWSQHVDPIWTKQLAIIFRQLGTTRDLDVIAEEIVPKLLKAGAPELKLPLSTQQTSISLQQLFQSLDFNNLILSLFQFIHQPNIDSSEKNNQKISIKKIIQLHQHIQRDVQNLLEQDITTLHRIRKRLKRLRYSIDFISSLYKSSEVKRYLQTLKPAQDMLGQYNDLILAETFFRNNIKNDPNAWFALGWIAANQQHQLQQAAHYLQIFANIRPFWHSA